MSLRKLLLLLSVIAMLLSFAGCNEGTPGAGFVNDKVVLTANGEDVIHDTYRYFYKNYKADDPTLSDDQLYQMVTKAIASDMAVTLLAQEYEVELTEEELVAVDDYVLSEIENRGERGYFVWLSKNNLTGDLFRHLYTQNLLETKLRQHMMNEAYDIIKSDDASFEADLEKNFMAAKQILIRNDEGDSAESNKALAEQLLEKLTAGEDFDTLMEQHSEDEGADPVYGRYFTYGQTIEEFENAVKELETGEMSGVVESSVGYHIILRCQLDREYIDNNYEDLRYLYQTRCVNEILEKTADSIEFEKVKDFDKISFN